jgi:hypothetical protein
MKKLLDATAELLVVVYAVLGVFMVRRPDALLLVTAIVVMGIGMRLWWRSWGDAFVHWWSGWQHGDR